MCLSHEKNVSPPPDFSISLLGSPSNQSGFPSTWLLLLGKNKITISNANVCMQDIALQDGKAPSGGALWVFNASLSMHRCRISNGEATSSSGGAMLIDGGSVVDLVQCYFINNRAQINGGALVVDVSRLSVTECVFEGNRCVYGGGGLHYRDSTLKIGLSTFSRNTVHGSGGAISAAIGKGGNLSSSSLVMDKCTMSANKARFAGALYVSGDHGDVGTEVAATNFPGCSCLTVRFFSTKPRSMAGALWRSQGRPAGL